jgi:hypothetical protein
MVRCRQGLSGDGFRVFVVLLAVAAIPVNPARSAEAPGLLGTIHRHVTQTTTITNNGDLNPYAVVVAPATTGKIQQGDVLVDNFNDLPICRAPAPRSSATVRQPRPRLCSPNCRKSSPNAPAASG